MKGLLPKLWAEQRRQDLCSAVAILVVGTLSAKQKIESSVPKFDLGHKAYELSE